MITKQMLKYTNLNISFKTSLFINKTLFLSFYQCVIDILIPLSLKLKTKKHWPGIIQNKAKNKNLNFYNEACN